MTHPHPDCTDKGGHYPHSFSPAPGLVAQCEGWLPSTTPVPADPGTVSPQAPFGTTAVRLQA